MRTATRTLLGLAVLLPAVAARDLRAQATMDAPARAVTFGLLAGVNIASLAGDDAEGLDSRTGFLVGGSLTFRLTPLVAIQPEALFVQKGASGDFVAEGVPIEAEVQLNYLEVPLLLRIDVPGGVAVRPFLIGGPSIAFNTSCDVEASAGGVSESADCEEAFEEEAETIDFGALIGGGLEFPLGTRALSIGVRYTFGFGEVVPDTDIKNRSLGIVAGLRF